MPFESLIRGAGGWDAEAVYGKRVNIPDYPEFDDAMRQAVKANKDILPEAGELVSATNTFNQAEIERFLKLTIPDLDEINTNISGNIAAMTRGELPKGVSDLISRKSAERAVAGGFGGSGMARSMEARDLGLTSLQMTEKGMLSAERWLTTVRNTQAPIMDVTSMFVSPAQQYAANESKFQRDLFAATMEAAPDPVARGKMDSEMALAGMILGIWGGGTPYGGQYKAPSYGGGGNGEKGGNGGERTNFYMSTPAPDYSSNSTGGWQSTGGWKSIMGGGAEYDYSEYA